jgi:biopolymer transport protein ExbB
MKDCFCDKQQGSVAIKSALVKYQAVKKEGFNSEEAAETIHKEIEEATHLRCQCYKRT